MNVEAECEVRIDLGGFDGAVQVSRSFGEELRVRSSTKWRPSGRT